MTQNSALLVQPNQSSITIFAQGPAINTSARVLLVCEPPPLRLSDDPRRDSMDARPASRPFRFFCSLLIAVDESPCTSSTVHKLVKLRVPPGERTPACSSDARRPSRAFLSRVDSPYGLNCGST